MSPPIRSMPTAHDSQKLISWDEVSRREAFASQEARLQLSSLPTGPPTSDSTRVSRTTTRGLAACHPASMNDRPVNSDTISRPTVDWEPDHEHERENTPDFLARLIAEGGGEHFRSRTPADSQATTTSASSSSDSRATVAKRGAAKRKQEREAAALALENEKLSTVNKLLPQQKAVACLMVAGLDGGRNEEMAVRAIMGTEGKRKRKRKGFSEA